jgi:hypothetical protein
MAPVYLNLLLRNARLLEEEYALIFTHSPILEFHGRGDEK